MERIDDIRDAVAKALETRGHGNRQFLEEIRTGQRDDCPFMVGAIACAELGRVSVTTD